TDRRDPFRVLPQSRSGRPAGRPSCRLGRVRRARCVDPVDGTRGPGGGGAAGLHHPRCRRVRHPSNVARSRPARRGRSHHEHVACDGLVMKYVSTRGSAPVLTFSDVLITGLARDGGLYVPESWPTIRPSRLRAFADMPYTDIAIEVMTPFVDGAIDE